MAASQNTHSLSNVSIDPEANLSIYLYLRDGSQCIPMSFPSKVQSPASPPSPNTTPAELNLERVMSMSLDQLDHLQERVCQMEISNYGLLTRIYGRFSAQSQPFPVVVASRLSSPEFPERGSTKHRRLLFSQYKNMLAIARDPTRCVNTIEPVTASGAKALQDYQMQLLLLAEQRRKHLKRKSEDDTHSNQQQRSPQFDAGQFRTIRKNSKVLDLEPRPVMFTQEGKDIVLTNHALSDYQQQLMLLEDQNRKRLRMARQEQDRARAHTDALEDVQKPVTYPIRSISFPVQRN